MSGKDPIDVEKYLEALPTFVERPENFHKDLREMLFSKQLQCALAFLEEQALLEEKHFLSIDYTQSGAALTALALKEKINGLRGAVSMLINLANGE
jgi:hypothetical protein